jgi:hypothetical protein
MQSSPAAHHFFRVQIFSSAPCSQTPSIYVLPLVWERPSFTPIQNNR